MKKFLYLASGAAIALASCSDDLALKNAQLENEAGVSKVIARMKTGAQTRTSVELGETGYSMVWNQGDALGIIGATADQYVDNARFALNGAGGEEDGEFTGQIEIPAESSYYGYYPYNPYMAPVTLGEGTITLPLQISGNQTFNSDAVQSNFLIGNKVTGSFAAGSSPAVAYATADEDNVLEFSFQQQASFLVFPVVGLGTVQKIELQIALGTNNYSTINFPSVYTNNTDYYQLWGNLNTTVTAPTEDNEMVATSQFLGSWETAQSGSSWSETTKTSYATITLNCANYELNPINPTNFWFVVPAGIELQGSMVYLTVYTSVDGGESTPTYLSRNMASFNGDDRGTKTIQNYIRALLDDNGQYWNADGDYAVITKLANFLEYAYIVSNDNAYATWTSSNGPQLSTSSLESFVNISGDAIESVKPAYLAADINFGGNAQTDLANWLNTFTPNWKQNDYLKGVYGEFVENGQITTIGGAQQFTITTAVPETSEEGTPEFNASLIGLQVVGNQIFAAKGGDGVSPSIVQYIDLNNVNLVVKDSDAPYGFLSVSKSNLKINEVGISGTSSIKLPAAPEAPAPAAMATPSTQYLFNNINSVRMGNGFTGDNTVYNNSSMIYANILNINTVTFDFTQDYVGIDQFNEIYTTYGGGYDYSTLTIAAAENATAPSSGYADALALITKIETTFGKNKAYASKAYSVVDNAEDPYSTSYWTGHQVTTNSGKVGTAEGFAFIVNFQGNTAPSYDIDLTRNINLMGSAVYTRGEGNAPGEYNYNEDNNVVINAYWTVYGNDINLIGNKYTVSNVFMNGTTDGKTPSKCEYEGYNILTLLGQGVTASDVNIDNVMLVPLKGGFGDDVTIITGALGNYPDGKISNVNVTGYYVQATEENVPGINNGSVGGLFNQITDEKYLKEPNLNPFNNVTMGTIDGLRTGYEIGYVAGTLNLSQEENPTSYLTGPYYNWFNLVEPQTASNGNYRIPYGKWSVIFQSNDYISVYMRNFGGNNYINAGNINDFFKLKSNVTIYLYQNGSPEATGWVTNSEGKLIPAPNTKPNN